MFIFQTMANCVNFNCYTLLLVCILSAISVSKCDQCIKRNYGHSSFVCVCNSSYCDEITIKSLPTSDQVHIYTSTTKSERFSFRYINKSPLTNKSSLTINVDRSVKFQKIKGFGGALTDSAAINILSLSLEAKNKLLKSYFSSSGAEYNLVRIPIASCDYSTHNYTYLDTKDDFNLTTFSLALEDIKYKIPLLKDIFKLKARNISLYASPWTAPAWMKTNNNEIGKGGLKGKAGDKYHKTWAKYFIKFFDSYKKHGINFWGFTVQNEPSNGLIVKSTWQSLGMTAAQQRDFIKLDLGPELSKSSYKDLKLMILDDQRLFMPSFLETVLADKEVSNYVSGIGIHWYWNWLMPASITMEPTHEEFPDKFMLATEACNKNQPINSLGSWENGAKYSDDILDVLNNWGVGWVDWNIVLNLQGGPNWANNFDNSPIITNSTGDEFYKQPMYYHMAHFSKFIKEDDHRVKSTATNDESPSSDYLKFVVIKSDSNLMKLVILNKWGTEKHVNVVDGKTTFSFVVPPSSIQTILWV